MNTLTCEGYGAVMASVQRRQLEFGSLDEVVADATRLLRDGYEQAGNWDLAQVAGHLATWMRFPLEGFPRKAPLMMWVLRNMFGRSLRRKILRERKMVERGFTLKETVPAPSGDAAGAVAKLRQTIERFKGHIGEYHPSPLFGAMSRDEYTQLQLIHCAHHLSFLVPHKAG